MNGRHLAFLLVVMWLTPASAGDVRRDLAVQSEALGRPLPYAIYLPDAYAREPHRRFPVVYLLHGHGGSAESWLKAGKAAEVTDRLIESAAIPPVIVVMPDAANSWYVDSPGSDTGGMMTSALSDDLIDHVDATYRTIATRGGRAIAGQSMGGFGALHLAFTHPERFAAVASLSGAIFTGPPEAASLRKLFGDVFGQPFDFEQYRAVSPLEQADEVDPEEAPAIYLTSGDDDFFEFYEGTSLLFLELREAGVPTELRITDGDHDWTYWTEALGPALQFLAAHLNSAGNGRNEDHADG